MTSDRMSLYDTKEMPIFPDVVSSFSLSRYLSQLPDSRYHQYSRRLVECPSVRPSVQLVAKSSLNPDHVLTLMTSYGRWSARQFYFHANSTVWRITYRIRLYTYSEQVGEGLNLNNKSSNLICPSQLGLYYPEGSVCTGLYYPVRAVVIGFYYPVGLVDERLYYQIDSVDSWLYYPVSSVGIRLYYPVATVDTGLYIIQYAQWAQDYIIQYVQWAHGYIIQ